MKPLLNQRHCLDTLLMRSEEHTSELQSQSNLVCRLLLEKKKSVNSTGRLTGSTGVAKSASSMDLRSARSRPMRVDVPMSDGPGRPTWPSLPVSLKFHWY